MPWDGEHAPGELVFFSGPMDCGKSTLALQMHYTQSSHGRRGALFTCQDRSGASVITSRIGLSAPAVEVGPDFDFWAHAVAELTTGTKLDFVICDESQFYTPEQVDQLARLVDELGIDVFAFGIMADFRTQLFPGSQRLVELADRVETLQVQPLCWCGARATHNARVVDGHMVTEGSQVVVGDTENHTAQVHYEVLCRKHHRRRVTKQMSLATLSPDLLPFEEDR
ncbi:thymidine kinase [Propionibacteriaceae bacterium G1746]|uniref:thymidine kinase n=1 Tax=Aestuariimicrobium sp. G57 TaxID=3418485 RepID=UPI003C1DD16B